MRRRTVAVLLAVLAAAGVTWAATAPAQGEATNVAGSTWER